jgi:hypothetical protein
LLEEILIDYPDLETEDIKACIAYKIKYCLCERTIVSGFFLFFYPLLDKCKRWRYDGAVLTVLVYLIQ